MLTYLGMAIVGLTLAFVGKEYLRLRRNISIAKASGIPYFITPIDPGGVMWSAICTNLIMPLLLRLPFCSNVLWIRWLDVSHTWTNLTKYTEPYGDIVMLVSPDGFLVTSFNAELNTQICARRIDFIKPTYAYKVLNHFGRNALSSEGEDWRRQRKIISPAFSEKSNAFAWEESIVQAQSMLKFWASTQGNDAEKMKVEKSAKDTGSLALNVICGAGFGIPQIWPHEDESILGKRQVAGLNSAKLTGDHKLSFKAAITRATGIEIIWLNFIPQWIMRRSPLKMHKEFMMYYDETRQYFKELFEHKRREKYFEPDTELKGTMDLMGPLIKASEHAGTTAIAEDKEIPDGVLTAEEIMGNSFIFIFAGFETSANTLNFTLIHLAINLAAQAHLQRDIDSIVGDRPATEWTYAVDMGRLYNSMVGAVLNESLRVTPPVVRVTKINRRGPETVNVSGRTMTIPHNSLINIDVVGTGLNKNYWPHSPSKISNKDHDLEDFVPERWLVANNVKTSTDQDSFDGLDNVSFERQGSLFRPAKGVAMNFSEGVRACPGRRFAQVEITATLSVIFKFYSVELDVSTWASDEEVARMSPVERKELYGKAIARARKLVRGAIPIIALKIEGEQVQLKFVRRGSERFKDLGL